MGEAALSQRLSQYCPSFSQL